MKLKEFRIMKGTVLCRTGLHIGAGKDTLEIGGVDGPVVKHPITQEPYIPGSSLKGRMRSLLEKKTGKMSVDHRSGRPTGEPCNCGQPGCIVCTLFGAHKNTKSQVAPTRLIVRDALLSETCRKKYQEFVTEKGRSYLEIKSENMINRLTGVAQNPRFFERVPEGTAFDLELVLQVFDDDDGDDLEKHVRECLDLVEKTYIGGSGSRGYGKVEIRDLETQTIAVSE